MGRGVNQFTSGRVSESLRPSDRCRTWLHKFVVRTLLIQNQSGNTQSFTPGKTTTLVNATSSGNFVLSEDPALVFNDINNPASDAQRSDIQVVFFGMTLPPLKVKMLASQRYFVAFGGAGNSCVLYFEP